MDSINTAISAKSAEEYSELSTLLRGLDPSVSSQVTKAAYDYESAEPRAILSIGLNKLWTRGYESYITNGFDVIIPRDILRIKTPGGASNIIISYMMFDVDIHHIDSTVADRPNSHAGNLNLNFIYPKLK